MYLPGFFASDVVSFDEVCRLVREALRQSPSDSKTDHS